MINFDEIKLSELTLLYVEDEDIIRRSTVGILRKFFKNILVAQDGRIGLELFEKNQQSIDIVLCDINMPRLNGIEMAEIIKSMNPNIPIVVTTAYSDKNYLLEAISIGINQYAIKPITIQELITKLQKAYFPIYQDNELKKQEALLSENSRNAEIGKVMLNVAHQWRQPLNELSLLIQSYKTAQRKGLLEENIEEYTIKGLNTIKKMSDTIDGFMNFFSPNKQKEFFKIKECIDESLYYTGSMFIIAGITIIKELDYNFELFGYKREFEEVVINILTNAKDEIEIKRIQNAVIRISSSYESNANILKIFNTSSHIKDSDMPNLFKPFFTTKKEHKGTGLGLFIAYDIITNHLKGEIHAQNADNGVEFTLKFEKIIRNVR